VQIDITTARKVDSKLNTVKAHLAAFSCAHLAYAI
jgi:hypothetical protein